MNQAQNKTKQNKKKFYLFICASAFLFVVARLSNKTLLELRAYEKKFILSD